MKTIGITIDDHKQDKFEAALREADYSFTTARLMPGVKLIKILVTPDDFDRAKEQVYRICKTLQINFNRSN